MVNINSTEASFKAAIINYTKRNGVITDKEISSMCIPRRITIELIRENHLEQVKVGRYKIPKRVKVDHPKLF